jgi:hypothetical protein
LLWLARDDPLWKSDSAMAKGGGGRKKFGLATIACFRLLAEGMNAVAGYCTGTSSFLYYYFFPLARPPTRRTEDPLT